MIFKLHLAILIICCACSCKNEQKQNITVEPEQIIKQNTGEVLPEVYEGKVMSIDGVEVAFTKYGNKEKSIVFVHGWSCNQTFWNAQIDYFKNDYQVITIDLGGHGKSGLGHRKDWTISAFADDVVAVVHYLKIEDVCIVGHSLGSMVAIEAGIKLKDKNAVVVCVDYLREGLKPLPKEVVDKQMVGFHKDFKGAMNGFVDYLLPETVDPKLKGKVIEAMTNGNPSVAISASIDLVTRDYTPSFNALAEERIPRLIINSAQRFTSPMWNLTFGFQVEIIKDSHHFLMMSNAEEFNEKLGAFVNAQL